MPNKIVALRTIESVLYRAQFESQFKEELSILEQDGFFEGENWGYNAGDIWRLFDSLPDSIKDGFYKLFPDVRERISDCSKKLAGLSIVQNPGLSLLLNNCFGEGSCAELDKDILEKLFALKTGIARYYMFYLIAINSSDNESSPRIILEGIESIEEYFQKVKGVLLFQGLKYLHVKGNIELGAMITFKGDVEIIVMPGTVLRLAGESRLVNVSVKVNEKGEITEENL